VVWCTHVSLCGTQTNIVGSSVLESLNIVNDGSEYSLHTLQYVKDPTEANGEGEAQNGEGERFEDYTSEGVIAGIIGGNSLKKMPSPWEFTPSYFLIKISRSNDNSPQIKYTIKGSVCGCGCVERFCFDV
jgi:hypothetical protein